MARILLIEDDPIAADVLEALLQRMGHGVVRVEGGEQGVERFRAERFDMVVADLLMPGKSGLETLLEIRRMDPAVKLIAISGDSPLQPAQATLSAAPCMGADAILSKPFSGAALAAVVDSLLGGGSDSAPSPQTK